MSLSTYGMCTVLHNCFKATMCHMSAPRTLCCALTCGMYLEFSLNRMEIRLPVFGQCPQIACKQFDSDISERMVGWHQWVAHQADEPPSVQGSNSFPFVDTATCHGLNWFSCQLHFGAVKQSGLRNIFCYSTHKQNTLFTVRKRLFLDPTNKEIHSCENLEARKDFEQSFHRQLASASFLQFVGSDFTGCSSNRANRPRIKSSWRDLQRVLSRQFP